MSTKRSTRRRLRDARRIQPSPSPVVLPRVCDRRWDPAIVTPERAAVVEVIARAFDLVPAPDAGHRTLHQAEACDNYGTCGRKQDHLGRWQDLPIEHLTRCQWALPHLDAQGIRYYMPAVMVHTLTSDDHCWIHESLRYTLIPNQDQAHDLRGYQRERFALLTAAQRAAILAFAGCVEVDASVIEAWQRAVDAADAPDWFEHFNPV